MAIPFIVSVKCVLLYFYIIQKMPSTNGSLGDFKASRDSFEKFKRRTEILGMAKVRARTNLKNLYLNSKIT